MTIFKWRFVSNLILTAALLFPVPGFTQTLPEGQGREILFTACTVCHGLDNITQPHKRFSAEEWEFYVYDMVARGAPVDEDDIETVKRYLIDNFAAR
jgi:hypothetical protein